MFELYLESYDFTTIYSIYIALFITVALQVLWLVNVESPLLDSPLKNSIFLLSESAAAFKYHAERSIDLHLLILKKIKMKVSPDEDSAHFSPE